MLQIYYDYINILAFYNLYRFENKKEILINDLIDYRNSIIESYNEDDNLNWDNPEWNEPLNIDFNDINEQDYLNNFIKNYSNYFYLKKNKIFLKSNISFSQIVLNLEYNIRDYNQICDKLVTISDDKHLRKILHIHTIDQLLLDYSKIEKQLENVYTKLYTKEDTLVIRKKLKHLMDLKALFYIKLSLLPNYTLEATRVSAIDNDYSDVFKTDYQDSPINIDLLDDSVNDGLYSISQHALFNNNLLYPVKIYADVEFLQLENNMEAQIKQELENDLLERDNDDDQELLSEHEWTIENVDCETEEKVFYLHYLNILNDFINTYGANKDLINSKTRLMYVLDNPKMRIYDDNNFNKEMKNIFDIKFEKETWDYLHEEVIAMIHDLFSKESDKYTIRKLLFIKTYYLLTPQEEIKQEINLYQQDKRYELFSSIIFNHNLINKDLEKGKQFFKTLNDLNN